MPRAPTRALTIVEVMIVVALVGLLAAVTGPALARYLRSPPAGHAMAPSPPASSAATDMTTPTPTVSQASTRCAAVDGPTADGLARLELILP